jgi:metal-dependent HD superfamily phosphatase/phosphodiesterase
LKLGEVSERLMVPLSKSGLRVSGAWVRIPPSPPVWRLKKMGNVIVAAIFGLIGIIVGIILNEVFRRKNRIESFASTVFERRLNIYEELFKKVQEAYEIADDVISNPAYSQEQRRDIVFVAGLDIAEFCDENAFFIDSDLGAHCTALLMGVEDIYPLGDEAEKQKAIREYRENRISTLRMIEEEAGVYQVKTLFKSISKPRLDSPFIAYLNELREEKRKKDAKNTSDS